MTNNFNLIIVINWLFFTAIKLDKNRKKLCKPVGSKTKHIIMILLVSVLVVAIVGCIGIIATVILLRLTLFKDKGYIFCTAAYSSGLVH